MLRSQGGGGAKAKGASFGDAGHTHKEGCPAVLQGHVHAPLHAYAADGPPFIAGRTHSRKARRRNQHLVRHSQQRHHRAQKLLHRKPISDQRDGPAAKGTVVLRAADVGPERALGPVQRPEQCHDACGYVPGPRAAASAAPRVAIAMKGECRRSFWGVNVLPVRWLMHPGAVGVVGSAGRHVMVPPFKVGVLMQ